MGAMLASTSCEGFGGDKIYWHHGVLISWQWVFFVPGAVSRKQRKATIMNFVSNWTPVWEVQVFRVSSPSSELFPHESWLRAPNLIGQRAIICLFTWQQAFFTQPQVTNTLCFLWQLRYESHPMFHQLDAFNVKQQQQEILDLITYYSSDQAAGEWPVITCCIFSCQSLVYRDVGCTIYIEFWPLHTLLLQNYCYITPTAECIIHKVTIMAV